jgi:hypothetical protein
MLYLSNNEISSALNETPVPYFRAASLEGCVDLIEKVYRDWKATA